jgi:hypothetical protein
MAIEDVPYNLTPEQVIELWDGYAAGQTVAQLARRFGKKHAPMYLRIQRSGGDPAHDPEAGKGASHARGPGGDLARARGRRLASSHR